MSKIVINDLSEKFREFQADDSEMIKFKNYFVDNYYQKREEIFQEILEEIGFEGVEFIEVKGYDLSYMEYHIYKFEQKMYIVTIKLKYDSYDINCYFTKEKTH
jgi:hypothetical protein